MGRQLQGRRKWEKNGDYKEERKCEGRDRRGERRHREDRESRDRHDDRHPRGAQVAPVVVYPPWFEQQQGAYVYRQQYQPAPAPTVASRCNSQDVGRVIGGILGGVLGNQIGSGSGRVIATLGGAVGGALIGGEIGRRMDAADQGCIGQVLEVAPVGRRVEWDGGATRYAVTPAAVVSRGKLQCRPYVLEMQTNRGWQRSEGTACRRPDGVWQTA